MNYYCTLFNVNYLTKGLAMISSLEKQSSLPFHIYVLAVDEQTLQILQNLKLKSVTVFALKDFENEDLLSVKKERSLAEYCWTCTPALIKYAIEKYRLPECTYIDADLYFFNDPEILFSEVKKTGKSVLITPHNYTPLFDQTDASGIFCVQFMYFKNDSGGNRVLADWYRKCIDWCYARVEQGKFGDQKYLDVWPREFQNEVHSLEQLGCLAPWNVQQFDVTNKDGHIYGKKESTLFPVIFYHFHGFNLRDSSRCFLGWYPLSKQVKSLIYKEYIQAIFKLEEQLGNSYAELYLRTFTVDTKHFWLRSLRKFFFQKFYFLFKMDL